MNIKKGLLFASGGIASALSAFHMINTLIFSGARKSVGHNSVWRCKDISVAFTEKGEGEPLLLIHGIGIGAGGYEWESNIHELSKRFKVYSIDLPGFGGSSKEKISYNSYYYAKLINSFIKRIIGKKTNVIALNQSSGFVLAGATLEPSLYNKVMVVNPYDKGMGASYSECPFVRNILPYPIIGTLVYNFISSRQSVLGFLDKITSIDENYSKTRGLMEKQYLNAHKFGVNNKYTVICLINGFFDTSIYYLLENCPVKRMIVISGDSVMPLFSDEKSLSITEIKGGEFYPNIYAAPKFHEVVTDYFTGKGVCEV